MHRIGVHGVRLTENQSKVQRKRKREEEKEEEEEEEGGRMPSKQYPALCYKRE